MTWTVRHYLDILRLAQVLARTNSRPLHPHYLIERRMLTGFTDQLVPYRSRYQYSGSAQTKHTRGAIFPKKTPCSPQNQLPSQFLIVLFHATDKLHCRNTTLVVIIVIRIRLKENSRHIHWNLSGGISEYLAYCIRKVHSRQSSAMSTA